MYPTFENSHYQQTQTRIGCSKTTTYKAYKHIATADFCTLDEDQHPKFAILIAATSEDCAQYSKIYFGRQSLDFQLHRLEESIVLRGMRRLNYTLSLRKSSENDLLRLLSSEGGPDGWVWKSEDLELRLNDHGGERGLLAFNPSMSRILIGLIKGPTVADLMETLSGWRLLFDENTLYVSLKSGLRPKKMEAALVTIWQRGAGTSRDLQLLIRAASSSKDPEDTTWLSASRKSHYHSS